MNRLMQQLFLFLALGVGLLTVQHWTSALAAADVDSPEAPAEWLVSIPLTDVDDTPYGAGAPTIAISPDRSKLLVAYETAITDTLPFADGNSIKNIYYAFSDDEGAFWSDSAPIHISDGTKSTAVSIAIDSSNMAHAVWLEGGRIVYKAEADWQNHTPSTLVEVSDTQTTDAVIGPSMAVGSDGTLHVVWGQRVTLGGAPNILYSKRPFGSSTWNAPTVVNPGSTFESSAPNLTIDENGHLHLAWQEQIFRADVGFPGSFVNYAYSSNGGSTWQVLDEVSSKASLPAGWSALLPQITAGDGQVEIVMTGYDRNTGAAGQDIQGAFRTICRNGNCTNLNGWGDGVDVLNGAYLSVNDNAPSNMLVGASRPGTCTQSVFHGLIEGNAERIWHNTGCGSIGAQPVTEANANIRYINPTLTQSRDWFLHLAYERIDGTGGLADERPQIYYRRLEPDIYLPVIVNQ